MRKINYSLLLRHFRKETNETENHQIDCWKDACVFNQKTYERFLKLYQEENPEAIKRYNNEELLCWSNIISKIFAEN